MPLLSRLRSEAYDRQLPLISGKSIVEARPLRNKNISLRWSIGKRGGCSTFSPSDIEREKIPEKKIWLTAFLFTSLAWEALPAKLRLAIIFVPKWNLGTRGIKAVSKSLPWLRLCRYQQLCSFRRWHDKPALDMPTYGGEVTASSIGLWIGGLLLAYQV